MNDARFNSILVVDDSSTNLRLLMNLLTEHGYTVYPASDGKLALEFVRSTLPDLILLDIRMPGMDGYEVCRRLKADMRTASIPVVFLSALEDERDKVRGFQAGGIDYITKPFQPEEMLARVGIHLRLRKLTEGLEEEVAARTEELTIANRRLQEEIAERVRAEEALSRLNEELDRRVQERTAELAARNEDLQRTDRDLIREREFGRALLESMADGVVACDAEGALALFNRTAREWHGVDPVRLPPKEWASHYDLFRADGVTPLPTGEIPLAMAFNGEEVRDVGMAIVAKGQAPRFILANGSIIKGADGRKLGAVVIMRDVTALRSLEQKLRRTNEELERRVADRTAKLEETARNLQEVHALSAALIDSLPGIFYVYDRDLRLRRWNRNHEIAMGYTPEELAGKRIADWHVTPENQRAAEEATRAVLDTGAVSTVFESTLLHKDGRLIPYLLTGTRIQGPEGPMMVGVGIDITERKRAEESLRESRQRLDNIIANSPGAIYRCANDEHWTMEFISAGITRITGYPAEDFLNNRVRSYASIIHPDDRRGVADAVAAGLARKNRYEMDYRLMTADGTSRRVREQGQGVFAADGRLLCLDGVIFDVTAQRKAEEALKLNAERTDALLQLNQMSGATEDELMGFAFEAAVRLTRSKFGYLALMNEDESVLTMQLWSREALAECKVPGTPRIYPVETTGLWGEAVRQRRPILTNDYAAANPWKKGTPEGHVKLIRHMNLPVIVDGEIVLVAGVGNKDEDYNETDVQQLTLMMEGLWRLIERRRAEEAIRQLNQELEQRVHDRTAQLEAVNKELEAFAYSVSHDLRAPLRHINGFVGLFRKRTGSTLDVESMHYLDTISKSADHMATLIDDLLSFSRLGRGELTKTRVDLGELVRDVIQGFGPETQGRDIDWKIAELPAVTGDQAMLRVVLANLISNALKFTQPRARAVIEIGCLPPTAAETVVFIRDNGVGFDMQYGGKLFGVFQRLHDAGEFEGTGIGLANVRRVISRHGGRTWAEGKTDEGATFYFALPHPKSSH